VRERCDLGRGRNLSSAIAASATSTVATVPGQQRPLSGREHHRDRGHLPGRGRLQVCTEGHWDLSLHPEHQGTISSDISIDSGP